MQVKEGTGREGVKVDQLVEKDEKKKKNYPKSKRKRISGYKSCYSKVHVIKRLKKKRWKREFKKRSD